MKDLAEITVESANQTEAQIREQLTKLGFDGIETSSESDQPEAEPPVVAPVVPAPKVTAPPTESTPSEIEDEAGDPAGDPDPAIPAAGEPPAKRKPGSARAREQAQHAKAEAKTLRLEVVDLKRRLAEKPAGTASEPAIAPVVPPVLAKEVEVVKPKPDPETFEQGVYDPAYVEAVADWRYDERERQKEATQRATKDAAELAAKTKTESDARDKVVAELKVEQDRWNSSAEGAKVRFADYDQVMNAVREKPVPMVLVTAVRDREDTEPAELAYWLGKNPEAEAKLIAMANKLPEKPTQRQVSNMIKSIDRALDEYVKELEAFEPSDDPADDPADDPEVPAIPASRETRAPAVATSAPAAKTPPQQNPSPKVKPAVPSTVGSRGATVGLSAMDRVKRGEQVNADEYRAEWEKKNGHLPL